METASELAKKYGLEQYLDRPADLNEAIFRLLLLQETMQMDQARKMKVGASRISVQRVVQGSFIAASSGDKLFRYAVETALKNGTFTVAVFQRKRFAGALRSFGVPEEKINEYCDSVVLDDNTSCIDRE